MTYFKFQFHLLPSFLLSALFFRWFCFTSLLSCAGASQVRCVNCKELFLIYSPSALAKSFRARLIGLKWRETPCKAERKPSSISSMNFILLSTIDRIYLLSPPPILSFCLASQRGWEKRERKLMWNERNFYHLSRQNINPLAPSFEQFPLSRLLSQFSPLILF